MSCLLLRREEKDEVRETGDGSVSPCFLFRKDDIIDGKEC